jgi:hypothetical protein
MTNEKRMTVHVQMHADVCGIAMALFGGNHEPSGCTR